MGGGVVQRKNDGSLDFDDLLPLAGEFGLYQVLLFCVTLPFYFFFSGVYYGQIFITEVPQEHWCWVPELENFTAIERRNLAIPEDEKGRFSFSRCYVYDVNWDDVITNMSAPSPNTPVKRCQNGWEYNMTDIPYPTITSEMDWVCEKDNYQATAQSIFFVGSALGGVLFGWVSDKYGRIPVTVFANVLGCIGGVASAFTQNMWQFSLCRFIVGMAYDNCIMMIYILVLEYTAPKYRTAMSNGSFAVFYTVATCALPWIALACDNWRVFALATSAPLCLAVLTSTVVPESPRWLLTKGRVDDALDKLRKIAKVNKKTIPQNMMDEFREATLKSSDTMEKISTLDLFKTPKLRKMFILISILYMLTSIVFDCLVRIVGQLGSDFFISFTIASATELPSLLLMVVIMDQLGRRWMIGGCFFIACASTLLSAFVPKGTASLSCSVIARFVANMSFNGVLQWAPELLPSGARGSGASIVHVCGYIATILSPYIIYLEKVQPYLPLLIIAAVAGLGSIIAMMIVETTGRTMPQTCADAELMASKQDFWEVPFLRNRQTENSTKQDIEL